MVFEYLEIPAMYFVAYLGRALVRQWDQLQKNIKFGIRADPFVGRVELNNIDMKEVYEEYFERKAIELQQWYKECEEMFSEPEDDSDLKFAPLDEYGIPNLAQAAIMPSGNKSIFAVPNPDPHGLRDTVRINTQLFSSLSRDNNRKIYIL